ncbi:MAG: hypothetical protein ACXAES_05055 [Promethearchaeota archaeon]|jgi:hypothetical protein
MAKKKKKEKRKKLEDNTDKLGTVSRILIGYSTPFNKINRNYTPKFNERSD